MRTTDIYLPFTFMPPLRGTTFRAFPVPGLTRPFSALSRLAISLNDSVFALPALELLGAVFRLVQVAAAEVRGHAAFDFYLFAVGVFFRALQVPCTRLFRRRCVSKSLGLWLSLGLWGPFGSAS